MTQTIGIYIFDEIEVLDFAGPFEVFSVANRVHARMEPEAAPLFSVVIIAERMQPVSARGNLPFQPNASIDAHPPLDVLLVPGGVVTAELERANVITWIAETAPSTRITASVCTGAFLLAKAGLLHGKKATTHWEDIPDLKSMFPDIDVQENIRWVDLGHIITSAGISAGIDMSLHLVSRLAGKELAIKTARQMEFDWQFPLTS
jgi:transcriptional regulator GlxA family with amidase domain